MLKKFSIILLLALVSVPVALAQGADDASKFHFSIYAEAGLGLTSFRSSDKALDPSFSSVVSPVAGIGANVRTIGRDSHADKGWLGLQAGVLYTKYGFKADGDIKITGDYLCIPIDVQVYPLENLYISAGPEICLNLGLSPKNARILDMDIDLNNRKANDVKIAVGAGYMLKSIPIGIQAKYLIGTSNFMSNLPWKNNQARLSIFYRFSFK